MAQNQKNTLSKVKPPQELDIRYSILNDIAEQIWDFLLPTTKPALWFNSVSFTALWSQKPRNKPFLVYLEEMWNRWGCTNKVKIILPLNLQSSTITFKASIFHILMDLSALMFSVILPTELSDICTARFCMVVGELCTASCCGVITWFISETGKICMKYNHYVRRCLMQSLNSKLNCLPFDPKVNRSHSKAIGKYVWSINIEGQNIDSKLPK